MPIRTKYRGRRRQREDRNVFRKEEEKEAGFSEASEREKRVSDACCHRSVERINAGTNEDIYFYKGTWEDRGVARNIPS